MADGLYFVASQHIERQIGFGHLFGFCGRHGCQERPHCVQTSVVSSICSVKPHPWSDSIHRWRHDRRNASWSLLRSPLGLPVLRLVSYAYMPSPLPRQVQWSLFARLSPLSAAFPVKKSGRLLQLFFRGLLSVHSRYGARSPSRQATLYTESSDSFVASAAVSIDTGWSEPVPGRELHPLKSSAFHGALFRQPSLSYVRDHRLMLTAVAW